jgi:hypothetical protein
MHAEEGIASVSRALPIAPVLSAAATSGTHVRVQGTLDSLASKSFQLEFFSSASCNSLGHGEGGKYLGSTSVATDAAGHASFTFTAATVVAVGAAVTATAMWVNSGTSEFSACRTTISVPTLLDIFLDGFETGGLGRWSRVQP